MEWYKGKKFITPINIFFSYEERLTAIVWIEWLRDNGIFTNLSDTEYNHFLQGWGEFFDELEVTTDGWALTAAREGNAIDSINTGIDIFDTCLKQTRC